MTKPKPYWSEFEIHNFRVEYDLEEGRYSFFYMDPRTSAWEKLGHIYKNDPAFNQERFQRCMIGILQQLLEAEKCVKNLEKNLTFTS
jgi:hypothetical protein